MGQKQKLGVAEKVELVQGYLSGKIRLGEVARRADAAIESVRSGCAITKQKAQRHAEKAALARV